MQRILQVILATSDPWSMSHLSQQPSKPAYYIKDCRILGPWGAISNRRIFNETVFSSISAKVWGKATLLRSDGPWLWSLSDVIWWPSREWSEPSTSTCHMSHPIPSVTNKSGIAFWVQSLVKPFCKGSFNNYSDLLNKQAPPKKKAGWDFYQVSKSSRS